MYYAVCNVLCAVLYLPNTSKQRFLHPLQRLLFESEWMSVNCLEHYNIILNRIISVELNAILCLFVDRPFNSSCTCIWTLLQIFRSTFWQESCNSASSPSPFFF